MNLRLAVLSVVFTERMRRRMLDEISCVTAAAFGVNAPEWSDMSVDSRLSEYASFTAREAGALLAHGDRESILSTKERLHSGAEKLGSLMRRRFGIRNADEAFTALILLYRAIGVDMEGGSFGEVKIRRCLFASYYTEPVCELISSLDQGLVSGLFAGASLEFRGRLTGGEAQCCASLSPERAR